MARRTDDFQAIRSEGGLLPPDLLRRVLDPKEKLDGTRPEDYRLPQGERLNEVITQSWNYLRKHWAEFRTAATNLPEGEAGTGLTNDKWSLPLLRELGFGLLPASAGPEVGGRTYAINRFFGPVPVHLVGCGLSLDRRAAGVRGAAAANPHGLLQEFLNRSPSHLWAIVSNGLRLRVLRDNQALSRQSFLEFDLEAMFAGEVYSDFVLLWLMAHATRFAPREGERPETCWLEQWTKLADEQGTRALGALRGGVEKALQSLGEGFTSHPKNTTLRDALRTRQVSPADFHGQLLRVVYRLIFLFVAEDRTIDGQSLLHPRDDSEAARLARERYAAHYSTERLRELASKIKGSRHGDLWRQFQLLVGALSGDANFAAAREHLALPALGSFLWDAASTAALNDTELTNYDFLEALRRLAFTRQGKVLRPVDYRNLGAEELGGVYESLLAFTPQISADGARFTFAEFAGNERKTSGSYYTPDSLVQCLLDSALDPVVEEAIKGKTGAEAEQAILALKVCDPAVGSGHFLVGAAHRLARHLARVRALAEGESEPSPLLYQHALRDVIGRCLYGVDVNPMAAELCRVSLWLEALEPGKPLSFLDHHIRVGNSLLGATPELVAAGLPDATFKSIEGDDKKACAVLKKRNKAERHGLGPLFAQQDAEIQARLQQAAAALEQLPDERPEEIRAKELAFRRHEQTDEYRHKKQLADAWCAAFVIKKHFSKPGSDASASGITQGHLNDLAAGRPLPADLAVEAERLSGQYQFLHWHLAFPEVFARGGFNCVLGNPPWEMPEVSDREFFDVRFPEIAREESARKRSALIDSLRQNQPTLHLEWTEFSRRHEGIRAFVSAAGRYPNSGAGRLNLFRVFVELGWESCRSRGRLGMVIPSGLATNAYERRLWTSLVKQHAVASLFDFENKNGLFPNVHRSAKFSLLTLGQNSTVILSACWLWDPSELAQTKRIVRLSIEELESWSGDDLSVPQFRTTSDLHLLKALSARHGTFSGHSDWRHIPRLMFSSSDEAFAPLPGDQIAVLNTNDSNRRVLPNGSELVPVYEGKMVGIFDHRQADIHVNPDNRARKAQEREVPEFEKTDPCRFARPQHWLKIQTVRTRRYSPQQGDWELVFCDVSSATNERTAICCIIPLSGLTRSLPAIYLESRNARHALLLAAVLSSLPLDYLARLKVSSNHLTQGILESLPIPARAVIESFFAQVGNIAWVLDRSLELIYTAWDLEPFAQDCGWSGPPFRWDEERRFLLRCELDAAFFHLYLPAEANGDWRWAEGEAAEDQVRLKASFPTPRDAVAYIMDTFHIVKRKDEAKWGDYRTKRVILEIYDALAESSRTGQPYETRLDPPPADPRVSHAPRPLERPAVPASVRPRLVALDESRVLRRVTSSRQERYRTCIPRLDLKAAAGQFGDEQRPEFEEWVEVNTSRPLRKGMFVAQVVGRSMEPLIPDGAYCLFQFKAPQVRNGMVALFQLHRSADPESGGRFTVKRLSVSTQTTAAEMQRVATLVPENRDYTRIPVEEDDVRMVAEFLEVLGPLGEPPPPEQLGD